MLCPTFSDSKKKKKPVANQSESSKNVDSRLGAAISNASSSGALRPDQLYTSTKTSVQNSMLDTTDNAVHINGSLLSPLSTEPANSCLKNESTHSKDRRENYLKDSDLTNYGSNSSSLKLDKFNGRGNDSFSMLNDYADSNGSKYKNPTKSPKVNNGDSDIIRTEYDRVGSKSQAWTNRSKQDYELNSSPSINDRAGKGMGCKEQNFHHQDSNGKLMLFINFLEFWINYDHQSKLKKKKS